MKEKVDFCNWCEDPNKPSEYHHPNGQVEHLAEDIKSDPRVIALANCVLFALQAFRNKAVYDKTIHKMEGWHQWFKRTLRKSGYGDLPQVQE